MTSRASLNHVYRSVWNPALGAMVAVAEIDGGPSAGGGCAQSQGGGFWGNQGTHGLTALALGVALAWGMAPSPTWANPTGGVAVQGQATMTTQGNQLLVTTQNAPGKNFSAINWQSFSIPAGSSTYFQQPSASSTSINRVVTATPTQIFGTLGSNGNLVLVNQSGITVGAGAVVDTAGFTASTLLMSDADAMNGRLRFGNAGLSASSGALSVQGNIISRGGDVVLIAPSVEVAQSAVVQSVGGSVVLAAGQQVEITGRGLEGIAMQVQAPTDQAVNLGTLQGDAIAMIAGTLKHSGLIRANTVVNEGGKVMLKATGDAIVQGSGQILATNSNGVGGSVQVLGNRVAVADSAVIDASGQEGGGTILVGGDYQGANANVPNASVSYLASGATLRADATGTGNGGKVIVWADDTTRAYGSISARGGAQGGDGGLVETSGHRYLDVNGVRVNASASNGAAGTWLLDPNDVTIVHGSNANDLNLSIAGGALTPTSNTSNSIISDSTIGANLAGGTTVSISTATTGNAGNGDITFDAGVNGEITINGGSVATQLNLNAVRNIVFTNSSAAASAFFGNGITFNSLPSTGSLSVNLNAGNKRITTDSNTSVTLNGNAFGNPFANPPVPPNLVLNVPDTYQWDNHGTLNINANAAVHLGSAATLQNHSGGTINVNGTSGWAIYSSSTLDDGIVINDGVMNVGMFTAFEAEFNQSSTGVLTVKDTTLNLQNVNLVSGAIELAPVGASIPSTLNVTEMHGQTGQFTDLAINRSEPAVTNQVYVNIGGSLGPVDALFARVNAPNAALSVAGGRAVALASATITSGASSFNSVTVGANASVLINNGALGITGLIFPDLTNFLFSSPGDIGLFAAGDLNLNIPLTTTGNIKLIAGWDGNLTSPSTSSIAQNYLTTSSLSAGNIDLAAPWGVTLGGALNASANITINSPAGTVATQQMTAANIGITSPWSVTFGGAITTPGNLTINSTYGPVAAETSTYLNAAMITTTYPVQVAGTTSISTGGNVSLNDTNNQFNNVSITSGGAVSLIANSSLVLGNITAASGLTIQANGSVTQSTGNIDTRSAQFGGGGGGNVTITGTSVALNSVIADGTYVQGDGFYVAGAGGTIFVRATAGNVSGSFQARGAINQGLDTTLDGGAGGNVTVVGAGGTVTLSGMDLSGGAAAIGGTNGAMGRWLVYADSPSVVAKGGLTSDFRQYSTPYSVSAVVPVSGNGFIYASNPGALSVTTTLSSGAASHTYGETPTVATGYTLSGFADSEDTASNIGLTGGVSLNHVMAALDNAGAYTLSYSSGLSSSVGYTFQAGTGLAYTVTPRPITITTSAVTKTYDGTNTASGTPVISVGSLVPNQTLSGGGFAFLDKNAGTGKTVNGSGFTVSDGNGGANYAITYAPNTTSIITPLAVTLSAPVITKTYDGAATYTTANADLAALSAGLLAGDTVTAATLSYANKNAGVSNKTVTLDAVTVSDGNSGGNYAVTRAGNSISTINKANVTLTAPSLTKTYDGGLTYTTTAGDLTSLSNALVAGDTVSAATMVYSNRNAGAGNKAVTVQSATLSDGNGGGNYNVTYAGNTNSTINPLAVTLTAPSIAKTYDGTTAYTTANADLTALSAGLLAGDTVTAATLSYANKNAGTSNKVATLDAVTVNDGNAGGNYTVTRAGNTTSTINPLAVTLAAPAITKSYDGTTTYTTANADLTALSAALQAGDTVTAATLSYANKNAGVSNKVATLDAVTVNDGNAGGNYIVTRAGNAISTINKANVTLTAPSITKTYDGGLAYTTTAGDLASLSGPLIAGDTVSAATLVYADRNAGTSNKAVTVQTYTLNDGNSGGNYNVTLAGNSTSTITPAALATWTGATTGLWSAAGNWDKLPDGNNVLAVSIPTGVTVTYDTSVAANTNVQTITSAGTVALSGGALSVSNAFNTSGLAQTGGSLSGAGALTVSNNFSQSAGTIAMGGAVSITQSTGNLSVGFGTLGGSSINLAAPSGAINQTVPQISPQTGAITTAGLLSTQAASYVSLLNPANQVGSFSASITGTGNVELASTGAVTVQSVNVTNGNLTINNVGGITTTSAVVASGTVDMTANSPLTVGSGGIQAGGNITLTATNLTSSGNVTINGNVVSTSGGVVILAANNYAQYATLSALQGVSVSASGALTFGPSAFTYGNPVSYLQAGVTILPPWTAALAGTGASNFVVTFLDQLIGAVDPTSPPVIVTTADGTYASFVLKDPLVAEDRNSTEANVCLP